MLDEDHYSCKCGYEVSVLDVLNKLIKLESCYTPSTKKVICGECNNEYEKFIQVEKFRCPECHQLMEEIRIEDNTINDDMSGDISGIAQLYQDPFAMFQQEPSGSVLQIMGVPYKTPIHSDSLGIMPDQVEEHKKMFPNIELDDQNRPVFTNTKEHQEYMDKCGIIKQPQKISKSKGKIYSYPGSRCS